MTNEPVYRVRAVLSKDGKTVTAFLRPMILTKYGDHGMCAVRPDEGGPSEWLPMAQIIPCDEQASAEAARIAERAKSDLIQKACADLETALGRTTDVKFL